VVRALADELARVEIPSLEKLLQPAGRHFIPPDLAGRLTANEASSADN